MNNIFEKLISTIKHDFLMILAIMGGGGVAVAFFADSMSTRNGSMTVLYFFHPNCWPIWYAICLWGAAIGLWCAFILKKCDSFRRTSLSTLFTGLTGMFVLGVILLNMENAAVIRKNLTWVFLWVGHSFNVRLYAPFVSIPYMELISYGKITWKLFVLPSSILLITVILILQARRRRFHAVAPESNTVEEP